MGYKKGYKAETYYYYIYPLYSDDTGMLFTYKQLVDMGLEEKTIRYWGWSHTKFKGHILINNTYMGLVILDKDGNVVNGSEEE